MKIFGREPALVISSIGSLVTLLVALNVPGVSAGTGAAITTFVTAAIIAVTTRPIAPALYTAVVAAGAALFTQYGLHVSDGVVAAVSAVMLTGFALFGIRPRVSPAGSPATSPAGSPPTSPATSPTSSPTSSPPTSPTSSPATSPTSSPPTSPTSSPATSPATNVTDGLAASPTGTSPRSTGPAGSAEGQRAA